MKQIHITLLTLILVLLGGVSAARGATESPYTVDFNTPIDTKVHNFKVASNWSHIVDSYTDDYGSTYYMAYSWSATYGETDGGLSIPKQEAGDNWDSGTVYDLLVTPKVSGTISFKVKCKSSSTDSFLQIFELNEGGTSNGKQLKKYSASDMGGSQEWATVTYDVTTPQRLCIRASYLYLDEFMAESAEINPEPGLQIMTAEPSQTTGVIYFNQQPNGKVLIKYTVTVKNTGEVELTRGMDNYTVSIVYGRNNTVVGTPTPVPETLAPGATSAPFDVTAEVTPKDIWYSTYASVALNLKENITNSILARANAQYKEYGPKFTFRRKGTLSSTTAVSGIGFGIVNESVTKEYEIYNNGNAPLVIKSVKVPAGFTSDAPVGQFTVEPDSIIPLALTLPGDQLSAYSDSLRIVYTLLGDEELTFKIPVAGKCANGKWFTTFSNDNNSFEYPEGSVAEGGIINKNEWSSAFSETNYFIQSYTNDSYATGNNKFITPKLHASAGDKVYYDVARDPDMKATEAAYIKVFVSKDRKNWGEPVKTYAYADFTSDQFRPEFIEMAEEGDYYIGFALFGMRLDDVIGLDKAAVSHDLYITDVTQPEEVQPGTEETATLKLIPVMAAAKDDYTVKYILDGVVTMIDSRALTASSKNEIQFQAKFTPESDTTRTIKGHFEIEFTDGTKFISEEKSTRIVCQSDFVFFGKGEPAGGKYKPSSLKTPIAFGKTNQNLSKAYEIYNWGTSPLKVKSINLPEGFTAKDDEGNVVDSVSVSGKARQAVNIAFTAETAGNYGGDLAITFVTPEGNDSTYTLPVSGVMLDPNKFYNNFGNADAVTWAPGTIYQKNVQTTWTGTYSDKNWYMYVTSGTSYKDRMFITPKLRAEAGETFMFDAKKDWSDAEVKVYISSTREGLAADSTRRLILALDAKSETDSLKLTDDFKTYSVNIPEAGDYYVGIEMAAKPWVDEIYGLSVVPVDYDLAITAFNVPETGMQNKPIAGTLKVGNFGLADVTADEYQVTVYVNGEACRQEGSVALPMEHKVANAGQDISLAIQSPKAGTFPVYAEITAGDKSWTTEPVNVTFSEEVLNSEITVGTPATSQNNKDVPVHLWYKNSESLSLYTPDMLGLADGDKISSITYKGAYTGSNTNGLKSTFSVYYKWVDDTELTKPASTGEYDATDMIPLREPSDYVWQRGGSASEMIDKIVLEPAEPLVYHEGKSLLILVRSIMTSTENYHLFEISNAGSSSNKCYAHKNDGTVGKFTGTWGTYNLPVLHLGLVAEARTVSGKVLNAAGEAVSGAVVNLTSADEANVQYEATTAADGTYTMNVIQSNRIYNLHAYAENVGEEFIDAVNLADESKAIDIQLRPVVVISDDATHAAVESEAVVYLNKVLTAGFNTLTLPFALDAEEMTALFGTEATVYKFKGDDGGLTPAARFEKVTAMEAGQPYLVALTADTKPAVFRRKAIAAELGTVNGTALQFVSTSARTPLTEGMFLLTEDMVKPSKIRVLEGETSLPAFSAYLKATSPSVTNVTLLLDVVPTGVDGIDTDNSANDAIYDLNGFRVKKANKGGIYIINGQKVIVM